MKRHLILTIVILLLTISLMAQNSLSKIGIHTNQFIGELIKGDLKLKSKLTTGISYSRRITRKKSLEYVFLPGIATKNIQVNTYDNDVTYIDVSNLIKYNFPNKRHKHRIIKYHCLLGLGTPFFIQVSNKSLNNYEFNLVPFYTLFALGAELALGKRLRFNISPSLKTELVSPIKNIDNSFNIGSSIIFGIQVII